MIDITTSATDDNQHEGNVPYFYSIFLIGYINKSFQTNKIELLRIYKIKIT